jgi:hypothetical protein
MQQTHYVQYIFPVGLLVTVFKIIKQESVKAPTLCSVHVFPTFLLLELSQNNNETDPLTDFYISNSLHL